MTGYRDVIFARPDGHRPLRLDLLLPPAADGPAPVVLWIHGGGWRAGARDELPPALSGLFEALNAAGFAVASVEYRLTGEARFPAQLDDVRAAATWLAGHADAVGLAADRLAVWGESAGGLLAGLLALTRPAVRCAVLLYPPTDLLALASGPAADGFAHDSADSPEGLLLGGVVHRLPATARAASPTSYVHKAAPPILLIHGAADRVVPAAQSELLAERLRAVGAPVELELVPDTDHVFAGHPDPARLIAHGIEFTARYL